MKPIYFVIKGSKDCIDCGKTKELERSMYCEKCRDALLKAKIREDN